MSPIIRSQTRHQPPSYLFGLVGFPLGHSLSPQIHAAALHALDLNGEYALYPVPPLPEGADQMGRLIARLRDGRLHGLNVTIPHKTRVIPYLDVLTPTADAIGAVNTLFRKNGLLIGDNTDSPGFWADLHTRLDLNHPVNRDALVLGAGGSARAVTHALVTQGYPVTIAARRLDQARELRDHFSAASEQLVAIQIESASLSGQAWSLIINTTPVGMHPHPNASPWPSDTPFPRRAAVYDLVYNPSETKLVKDAREAGLQAVSGLGMLVEQAVLAFERWTGLESPRNEMMAAVCG
jgi:shikimate dehydrogenase